jgi:hypothetical protein
MSPLEILQSTLQKLQTYASQYFSALYRSSICFWTTPPLPAGANVLTGAFAFFMIYTARRQFSQPTDTETIAQIIFYGTLIFTIVCGILVIFDPLYAQDRIMMWRKLVSTVCIGSILGCIFIVLDSVLPWIDAVFAFAYSRNWIPEANLLISAVAAFLAFVVLVANSVSKGRAPCTLFGVRQITWSGVILVLLFLGVHLLVTKSS